MDEWRRGLDAYDKRLISADKWIDKAIEGIEGDLVCVTLDDGLAEQWPAIIECENRGLTVAVNVYTAPLVGIVHQLERYRQVRNVAYGGVDAFYQRWEQEAGVLTVPECYLWDRRYLTQPDRLFRYWRNEVASPLDYERVMDCLGAYLSPLGLTHWFSASDLRALRARGHTVGFHSHSHPTVMHTLTKEQQALEYATSKHILEGVLRETVNIAAHPCGSVTDDGMAWMKANKIRLAWGATMDGSYPYNVPRWSTGNWTL